MLAFLKVIYRLETGKFLIARYAADKYFRLLFLRKSRTKSFYVPQFIKRFDLLTTCIIVRGYNNILIMPSMNNNLRSKGPQYQITLKNSWTVSKRENMNITGRRGHKKLMRQLEVEINCRFCVMTT